MASRKDLLPVSFAQNLFGFSLRFFFFSTRAMAHFCVVLCLLSDACLQAHGPWQHLSKRSVHTLAKRPRSKASDTVIIAVLLALAGTSWLEQNARCVNSPMAWLVSAVVLFMTWHSPLLKSPKSECSSGKHCSCMYVSMCKRGETVAHAPFSPSIGYSSGF